MSEHLLDRFEEAWQEGRPPALEDVLAAVPASDRRPLLEELVKIDLEYRWRGAGSFDRPPLLEGYAARHSELGRPERLPVELIGWEYLVRRRYGDRPAADEYHIRFAGHGEALRAELRRVDAELAAEFARSTRKPSPVRGAVSSASAALLAPTPVVSVPSLIQALADCQLLSAARLERLAGETFADSRTLGRALLQRGWLTPYQLNQLFRGRGGDLLLGPYLLLERLGEGGVGQVFKAHHQKLNRVVALKVIRKDLLADAEVIGRFYREMEIVGQLSHPNIVRAYDAGPVGATPVLVMEYVEGTDLARQVRRHGPLPPAEACDYIRQAAGGLAHAHEKGLVHRDIKPSNLLVSVKEEGGRPESEAVSVGVPSSFGLIKILDMGLARLQWTVNGEVTNLTTPVGAAVIGTPDYLAPEQALDFHAADIRADIYSLGCTFFYLLSGEPPFPGGTLTEKLLRHQQADPPPLAAPPAVAEIVSRMLAKRPSERFQTPAEVVRALARVSEPASSWAEPGAEKSGVAGAPGPRKMLQRLAIAAAGVIAAGLLLIAILPRWPVPPPPVPVSPTAELEELCAHLADPGVTLETAWGRFQAFRRRHPGTPEENQAIDLLQHYLFTLRSRSPGTPRAVQARVFLRQMPWPLDRLQRQDIRREDRPPRSPPELVAVFGKHGRPAVGSVAVHPDGLFVAGGGFDHSIRLWDAATGREVHAWEGLAGPLHALAFSPDGLTLAAGVPDGSVKMWNVATANEQGELSLRAKNAAITHLEFAPDGKTLATANARGTLRLWQLSPPKDRLLWQGKPGHPLHGLAYSPDGRLLAAVLGPGTVKFWQVPGGKTLPDLSAPGARSAAFTPDSRAVAVGLAPTNAIKLHDLAQRKELRTFRAAQPTLGHSLFFPPDGRLLGVGERGSVMWWDASSGKEQGKRALLGEILRDAALAPDGRHLALASNNGTVLIFRRPAPR